MKNISFHLKRPDAETSQSIYARLFVNGKPVKIYSGMRILPKHWNPATQRVRGSVAEASHINDWLDRMKHDLNDILLESRHRKTTLTPETIKQSYHRLTKGAGAPSSDDLLSVYDRWTDAVKQSRSPRTMTVYKTARKHLADYLASRKRTTVISTVDSALLNDFMSYLTDKAKLQNSSAWKVLKTFKTFLKWCYENELTQSRSFEKLRRSEVNDVDKEMVRLTKEELRALADLDLDDAPPLRNVRDQFVLQCLTGVRFGDLQKIIAQPDLYFDGECIRLVTEKNIRPATVPLLDRAKTIMENAGSMHPITNQRFNAMIKEVAERAGLKRRVSLSEFRGKKREEIVEPLHRLVSSHMAKRTFVSIMAASGVSTEAIKKFTGNSDSTIGRYLILFEQDIKREMEKVEGLI